MAVEMSIQEYIRERSDKEAISQFNQLISCHDTLCRCVLKINPYQIHQFREVPVFQQTVKDLHIDCTCHKPSHSSLGQS